MRLMPDNSQLFKNVSISSIDILLQIPQHFSGFFRGQNTDLELCPTILRGIENRNHIEEIERNIFDEYKKRARMFNLPDYKCDFDWVSHIQHYGGPTRLLDFTYSFMIALFFVIKSFNYNEPCIWFVNKKRFLKAKGYNDKYEFFTKKKENYINFKIGDSSSAKVDFIEPEIFNKRLNNQQGLFAVQKNLKQSFEISLFSTFKELLPFNYIDYSKEINKYSIDLDNINSISDDSTIIRFDLNEIISKNDELKKVKAILNNLNIVSDVIYPDFYGLSLRMYDFIEQ